MVYAVDGHWSSWSEWTPCSADCGEGLETRSRTCTDPYPQHGGRPCQGLELESMPCIKRTNCPGMFSKHRSHGFNCRAASLKRVLEYSNTTRVVNYSSNFLLLEYSVISISGSKFQFSVAVKNHAWLRPWPFGSPCTLTNQSISPFFVIGSLYLTASGINEYLSTR